MKKLKWIQKQVDDLLNYTNISKIKIKAAPPYCNNEINAFAFYDEEEGHEILITKPLLKQNEDFIIKYMAHEIGHIALCHYPGITSPEQEFGANEYAKNLLRRYGWTENRLDTAFFETMNECPKSKWDNYEQVKLGHYPTWDEVMDHWKKI